MDDGFNFDDIDEQALEEIDFGGTNGPLAPDELEPSGGFVRQPSRPHGGVFGAVSTTGALFME